MDLGQGLKLQLRPSFPQCQGRGAGDAGENARPRKLFILYIYIYRINQNPVQCMNMKHPAYWLKPRTRKHMRWLWICNWNYDWSITFWGPCPPLFHFDIWASWVDPGYFSTSIFYNEWDVHIGTSEKTFVCRLSQIGRGSPSFFSGMVVNTLIN